MESESTEAINRCRWKAFDVVYCLFGRGGSAHGVADAACRELLGYLSDIAHATDLDGVLAEISALQRALGGE